VSEEVKKKGLFDRLFKGSLYDEDEYTDDKGEVGAEASEEPKPPMQEEAAEENVEIAAEAAKEQPERAEVSVAEVTAAEPTAPDAPVTPDEQSEEVTDEVVDEVLEVVAEAEAAEEPVTEEAEKEGLFGRLRKGLSKTRGSLSGKIDRALFGKKVVDAETLEELEEALVTADIGINTALRLVEEVTERVNRKELTDPEALRQHLKSRIREILVEDEGHFVLGESRPYVVLVIGVNGVGKTTTIAKIAARHIAEGNKVIIGAADTFRAAAIEQLCTWGDRVGADVVCHQHGSDPAAVAFDTLEAAKARGADLVLIDTAGRLHTKTNLREEMKKIRRLVGNAVEGAPHEVMLVLDSTTGQNAINQAIQFRDTVGVDSIALTKLDGTAKGGVIVGICDELKIPVKFIGIGEQVDDLRPFEAEQFIDALF
jgi:fused signal recognition particle receptor